MEQILYVSILMIPAIYTGRSTAYLEISERQHNFNRIYIFISFRVMPVSTVIVCLALSAAKTWVYYSQYCVGTLPV